MRSAQANFFLNGSYKVDGVWSLNALLLEPSQGFDHHDATHAVIHRLSRVAAMGEFCEGACRNDWISGSDAQRFGFFLRSGTNIKEDIFVRRHAIAFFRWRDVNASQSADCRNRPSIRQDYP